MFDANDEAEIISAPNGHSRSLQRLQRVTLVGNFPPRRCGIASFTSDLYEALLEAHPGLGCNVVAMNEDSVAYSYPDAVSQQILQNDPESYVRAADAITLSRADVVCVQHEFGIFGGAAGADVLALTAGLDVPLVTTFHTVLDVPNLDQRKVMETLIEQSARVVVMSQKGKEILTSLYKAPNRKIAVIPHGAPNVEMGGTREMKGQLGLQGRDIILTFGLLSPNKGLETMIKALPRVVAARPRALYVVVGATHPHLMAREGEAYRDRLSALAETLGVGDNLMFVNAFVDTSALLAYLTAADVYVTPYLNQAQVTSGTLAYAVALGKPVVSTPYWHAAELLKDGVGVLTPFNDHDAVADAVTQLLSDEELRRMQCERAYKRGRETIWRRVGERYLEVFDDVRAERRVKSKTLPHNVFLPALSLRAVERLTDATGIFQHARFSVPDRRHGYCVDDNARALMLTQRLGAAGMRGPTTARLASVYASFLDYAWNPETQRFRNFMSFNRTWLEEAGSEDSFGRSLWALGETVRYAEDVELRRWAQHLGGEAAAHADNLTSIRSLAFSILGLCDMASAGDETARGAVASLAARLRSAFELNRRPDWVWFEPVLAYDNARLPEALLRAGSLLGSNDLQIAGLDSLTWLTALHTAPNERFRAVGSHSFGRSYCAPAIFDQQPLEAAAAVDASWAAFDITDDPRWLQEAHRAFNWFLGENDLRAKIADVEQGGCFDGLRSDGPNLNQGAESVLSYQLALCAMRVRRRSQRLAPVF